jgi:hypothetical protein
VNKSTLNDRAHIRNSFRATGSLGVDRNDMQGHENYHRGCHSYLPWQLEPDGHQIVEKSLASSHWPILVAFNP